jgi:hypothetical protein
MDEQVVTRKRDRAGKFVKKDVKPVKIYAVVSPSDYEQLASMVPDDGTISDVFREAIALYLRQNHEKV